MANYNKSKIVDFLNRSDAEVIADAKGRIFEDLAVYLMEKFQGVRVADRNVLDSTGAQELDVVFWNNRVKSPFDFLDPILIAECKNEASPYCRGGPTPVSELRTHPKPNVRDVL